MNTEKQNSTVLHPSSRATREQARGAVGLRPVALLTLAIGTCAVVAVASASAQAAHPSSHSETAPAPQVATSSPSAGPPPSPTQRPTRSSASSYLTPGTTTTCFMTEPVTNGTAAESLTIHLRRQLRRSGNTLSEWLVVDRTTTGNASAMVPLFVKVRDHVSSDVLGSATHATPVSAPEAVAGATEVPCHQQAPVPIRWHARSYSSIATRRVPLAV